MSEEILNAKIQLHRNILLRVIHRLDLGEEIAQEISSLEDPLLQQLERYRELPFEAIGKRTQELEGILDDMVMLRNEILVYTPEDAKETE